MKITKKLSSVLMKVSWALFREVVYWALVLVLAVVAGLVFFSSVNTPIKLKAFTVQTGSMSPNISTGSVVFVRRQGVYSKGDVITFKSEGDRNIENPQKTITHRIVEASVVDGETAYITKGDANDGPDFNPVRKDLVLGKVIFSLPLLGFLLHFSKTIEGLVIVIVIPATLIIYSELMSIKNEAKKLIEESKRRKLTALEHVEVNTGKEVIAAESWPRKLKRRFLRQKV